MDWFVMGSDSAGMRVTFVEAWCDASARVVMHS
jgi:hypothetical protein